MIRAARLCAVLLTAGHVLVPTTLAMDCPDLVGRWPYGSASGVAVSGDFAYFGSGTVLLVADVSNRAAPFIVAEVVLPGRGCGCGNKQSSRRNRVAGWYSGDCRVFGCYGGGFGIRRNQSRTNE